MPGARRTRKGQTEIHPSAQIRGDGAGYATSNGPDRYDGRQTLDTRAAERAVGQRREAAPGLSDMAGPQPLEDVECQQARDPRSHETRYGDLQDRVAVRPAADVDL